MTLIKKIKKKVRFISKPYKSEEEKKAYEKKYKESRMSAIKAKGVREGRRSVSRSLLKTFGRAVDRSFQTGKAVKKKIPKRKKGRRVIVKEIYRVKKQRADRPSFQTTGLGYEPNVDFFMPTGWRRKKKRRRR